MPLCHPYINFLYTIISTHCLLSQLSVFFMTHSEQFYAHCPLTSVVAGLLLMPGGIHGQVYARPPYIPYVRTCMLQGGVILYPSPPLGGTHRSEPFVLYPIVLYSTINQLRLLQLSKASCPSKKHNNTIKTYKWIQRSGAIVETQHD